MNFTRVVLLVLLACAFVIACRTANLITNVQEPRVAQRVTAARASPSPSRARAIPTKSRVLPRPTRVPSKLIPTEPLPTQPPPPTVPPPPSATHKPAPTRKPLPTPTPTPAGPTETPAPTRCPQQYCVVYRGCQTDAGNTIVEGIVYNNGVPEDGVAVRVAKAQGAYPMVDDFVSGTDPINPGQPDAKNPGRYILQIVAGAPREGNWWVFVVDRPNGTKQISEAKLIHTNDDPFNPANCQHAFVDFVR